MTVYDRDYATPADAVTAWLDQFKVDASGDITFVSGSDTFHVWWMHRALQKIAYDFAISGDDEINFSKPNPSTSEALGTIIVLKDHTTDYSVAYTVTELVMESHFGGSVEEELSGDIYYGLIVYGAVPTPMPIKIIQNDIELTSHWGNGKNQTAGNVLLRVMIRGTIAGVDTDNLTVSPKISTWGYTYAVWETTLGPGEKVASLTTEADPKNQTSLGTVQAYSISQSTGYKLLDIDGAGNKPYIGEWSRSPESNNQALYEFVKSLVVDGSALTLHGVDGDLWTGRLFDVDTFTPGTGTWNESGNEDLTWGSGATAGTGTLLGVDDTDATSSARLVLHLNTGVGPVNGVTITGTSTADCTLTADSTKMSTHPHHIGQFVGSWIGALGMGLLAGELSSADSVKDLDGNVVAPLDSVTVQIDVICGDTGDAPHVFLAEKHGSNNAPDYAVYACDGNSGGAGVIDVDSIASDTPQQGYVGVLATGETTYEFYEYDSWTGNQFVLVGTLSNAITAADPAFHAIFYELAAGGGLTKSLSNDFIYTDDTTVIGWVRHGDPTIPDKPIEIGGTIGSGGLSLSVTLVDET